MKTITFDKLSETFEFVKNSEYKGVKGICCFDSEKPGKVLGVSMCTHGNEPSGLAVLWYCLQNSFLTKNLQRGKVIFVLNNLKAAEKSFQADNFEERLTDRFIDINYNRSPWNILELKNDNRYEIKRALELYPVYQEFEIGFDIHSTTSDSEPMIIEDKNLSFQLYNGFPIKILIKNIVDILVGMPVIKLYGGIDKDITNIIIESGDHENPDSFRNAIKCTQSLLQNLDMIPKLSEIPEHQEFYEYEVVQPILFANESYELTKVFDSFEDIKKGQVLATGDGKDIISPCDGHILMPPIRTKPIRITEEIMFITKEKRN